MPIAFDAQCGNAHAQPTSVTTPAYTTANTIAPGLVLLLISWFHATATASITTTGGLTWTLDKTVKTGSDNLSLYSAPAPSGLASGTSLQATFSITSTAQAISAWSLSGVNLTVAAENTSSATQGAGTAWASGAMTPATATSVMVGMGMTDGSTTTSTPVAGFTEVPATAGDFNEAASTEVWTQIYKLLPSGSTTASGTWAVSSVVSAGVSAIYLAASDSAPITFNSIPFMPAMGTF